MGSVADKLSDNITHMRYLSTTAWRRLLPFKNATAGALDVSAHRVFGALRPSGTDFLKDTFMLLLYQRQALLRIKQ